jgi:hypothetical protein
MKRKVPADFMDKFLSGKPSDGPKSTPQRPSEVPTEARQGPAEDPLVQGKLWLSAETWEALERHFSASRTPVSTGLRGWIVERMEREGLR